MSNYIRIPNKAVQNLTTRDKLTLIVVYAFIRSQIKDASNKASITEEELKERCHICLKSAWNHIQTLKKVGLIKIVEKKKGESQFPYNVYLVEFPEDDFTMINPDLLTDPNLSTEQKGLLILLKTHCHEGTNHMDYPSHNQVHDILKINRDKLSKMISLLQDMKQVKIIGKSLIITNENILMVYDANCFDVAYLIIYRYCWLKGVVPPIKGDRSSFTNNIGRIIELYPTKQMLAKALLTRCKNLPSNVSLSYFCEALCNAHFLKRERIKPDFTFTM